MECSSTHQQRVRERERERERYTHIHTHYLAHVELGA